MKRGIKSLAFMALVMVFAAGLLCASMAAPGQALASVSGCPQTPGAMAMAGCGHPGYLCGFDSANSLFSHGALSSARSSDLLKDALSSAVGDSAIDVSIDLVFPGAREWKNASLAEPGKVSLRLFNSVLNL